MLVGRRVGARVSLRGHYSCSPIRKSGQGTAGKKNLLYRESHVLKSDGEETSSQGYGDLTGRIQECLGMQ